MQEWIYSQALMLIRTPISQTVNSFMNVNTFLKILAFSIAAWNLSISFIKQLKKLQIKLLIRCHIIIGHLCHYFVRIYLTESKLDNSDSILSIQTENASKKHVL